MSEKKKYSYAVTVDLGQLLGARLEKVCAATRRSKTSIVQECVDRSLSHLERLSARIAELDANEGGGR